MTETKNRVLPRTRCTKADWDRYQKAWRAALKRDPELWFSEWIRSALHERATRDLERGAP